jgi:hypothetical protein
MFLTFKDKSKSEVGRKTNKATVNEDDSDKDEKESKGKSIKIKAKVRL